VRIFFTALANLLIFTALAALLIGTSLVTFAGNGPAKTHTIGKKAKPQNTEWDAYVAKYLEDAFKLNPDMALGAGNHAYDSVLVVPDISYRKNLDIFLAENRSRLASFAPIKLSATERIDRTILLKDLDQNEFNLKELKSWMWNPADYNVCGSFSEILANGRIAKKSRVQALVARMAKVPAYYSAAAININMPSAVHVKLAIAQNKGGMVVFDEIIDSLKATKPAPAQLAKATARATAAKASILKYIKYLEAIPADKTKDFRLDSALYYHKFDLYIQTGQTAGQVYKAALARKTLLHGKMYKLAAELAPKYLPETERTKIAADTLALIKAVIDKISQDHCKPEEFQDKIKAQIPELAAFVDKNNLLYQDPSKPLVVRKEPAYMAGVAGASISSPGPFEKEANTYYNVGSLAAMAPAEQESFLREYNTYTLQILNIHEAIPGHYTQLVYANRSPSLVKSIFGNGAMIEGWAVYAEQMMLENGYGNNSQELWLMYYKWNLRTVCNTILDYSIHVKNLQEQQALDLLLRQAFQTEAEAKGKWKRATLSSVQLCSYFSGFQGFLRLRQQYPALGVKAFNEKVLSYGSAPLAQIELAMKEGN